ncbi:hypothetical protein [Comamonas aquatica]|uniref:Uncharacterized protein n=1 Tax=Comamonas aquatica TaxID=225991 RepID=A0AA42HUC8_9BURK|nr:hypothetical protein [Comamonas aquatica]MDH0364660.1 hypothetical protein [Comamonas aquatica]
MSSMFKKTGCSEAVGKSCGFVTHPQRLPEAYITIMMMVLLPYQAPSKALMRGFKAKDQAKATLCPSLCPSLQERVWQQLRNCYPTVGEQFGTPCS